MYNILVLKFKNILKNYTCIKLLFYEKYTFTTIFKKLKMKFPVRRKMNNFEDYHSNEDFPQDNNTDGELLDNGLSRSNWN